jgi:hypothetical protein
MEARVVGLRAKPELNGTTVAVLSYVGNRARFAVETSKSERILLKPGALDFGFPLAPYETAELEKVCEGAKLYADKGRAIAEFFLAQLYWESALGVDEDISARNEQMAQHGIDIVVMAWIRTHGQSLEVLKHGLAVAAGLACVPGARARMEAADTLELIANLLRDVPDRIVNHNGICLLVEIYYRGHGFEACATGRNSFTRRSVEIGLFGTLIESMIRYRSDEAIQASAVRLLVCFDQRGQHGPQIWSAARASGAVHHMVRLASLYAPTDADSVLAREPLEVSSGPAGSGESGRQATVHRLALAVLSALIHIADPGSAVQADMDSAERGRRELVVQDGLAAQLLQQGQYAALRYGCNFGDSPHLLGPARIVESYQEWNRRLQDGPHLGAEARKLRFLLHGVPPLSEWVADGIDPQGESQQLAGVLAVGILEGLSQYSE